MDRPNTYKCTDLLGPVSCTGVYGPVQATEYILITLITHCDFSCAFPLLALEVDWWPIQVIEPGLILSSDG